jgi:hypothetical protein
MTQNNEAFDKWFGETYNDLQFNKAGMIDAWKAATQASESEINSLKQRVEELDNKLDSFHKMLYMVFENKQPIDNLYEAWHRLPACELMAVIGSAIQEIQWYQQENPKLQADNLRLREALEDLAEFSNNRERIDKLLSSTPAQSLEDHDNQIIQMCADKAEEMALYAGIDIAEAIRLLKATP